MVIPAGFSLVVADGNVAAFGLPALGAVVLGGISFLLARGSTGYVAIQDVFFVVVFGWVGVAVVGSVPFVLSGVMAPADAYFNSMAGFTTTGASTVSPEDLAPSLLLWRSMTQWVGGIGIVVLFVAVAPLVGFGAAQLYAAEAATPVMERLTPRIQDTAKVLVYIYCGLTLGGVAALLLAGMGPFDSINHAMTTVATGGYSTRSDSIGPSSCP